MGRKQYLTDLKEQNSGYNPEEIKSQDHLQLIDVKILDHFIIGDGNYTSFAEKGWI